MITLDRRRFIGAGLGLGGALLVGCDAGGDATPSADGGPPADSGPRPDAPRPDAAPPACADPFKGGTKLGDMDILSGDVASAPPFGRLLGQGHDGRLYFDLRRLDPGKLDNTTNADFYVRTMFPDKLDTSKPWAIRVHGQVDQERSLSLADLAPLVKDRGQVLLECSGNTRHGHFGLLSAARWSGALLSDVLDRLVKVKPGATRVLVSGFDEHTWKSTHSTPGASWVFTLKEMRAFKGFLATKMNGVPLPKNHGQPVRLVLPRWYGCTNIKWVNEIKLTGESEPATSQMKEFWSRTHQRAPHTMAREYIPATMDAAAMPLRIERWRVGGKIVYRVVGMMWGGYKLTKSLLIRFQAAGRGAFVPVTVCPPARTNDTWTLWTHAWRPTAPGKYRIRCRFGDTGVRTRRLDYGHYDRWVTITEV